MEADFSGYATKAGLKCSDGRTILPDAFKAQDKMKVPLVWQHGHNDPMNVLGHAILENRADGVYAYGFFNKSEKAEHARGLVEHGDITMMSIWANDLVERAKRVLHGAIREVSLVLSGANPGAVIENVTLRHANGDEDILDEDVIIYTGLTLVHGDGATVDETEDDDDDSNKDQKIKNLISHATGSDGEETIQDVYDSMSDKQKQVLHYMIGQALESAGSGDMAQSALGDDATDQEVYDSFTDQQKEFVHFMLGEALEHADTLPEDATIQDVYDSMSEAQKEVVHYMIGEALDSAGTAGHSNLEDGTDDNTKGDSKTMVHMNVFEKKEEATAPSISHADMKGIIADATKGGGSSLKDAVEAYAIAHGIEDIDILFPDAVAIEKTPEFLQRRVEWVASFLGAVTKTPFSRIKTYSADLTFEDARAKGYVKGAMKKEEFFAVAKRVTTPTTVYKKQALDRDDVVDITDFDVVAWLKAEMRLMLDEEIARAALMGDGRDVSHEDKINEGNIRPIAKEGELFATTVNVNIDDASSSVNEVIDAIVANRKYYKGTGQPNMYTSETLISMFLLLKDTLGRRIYKNIDEVASELRVREIIPVEVMEEEPALLAIIVNPVDYNIGTTAGGQVSMFENFDIDYNKQKYLIETRCSGALVRLKSALIVRKVAGSAVLVTPAAPTFDPDTGLLTINDTAHVVYKNAVTNAVLTNGASPYTVASGDSVSVVATPATGYYFASSVGDEWTFTAD